MPTPFSAFYESLRSLLGDRQVNGAWNYPDAKLDSALRTAFATGRTPAPYALADANGDAVTLTANGLQSATQILQEVKLGGDFARICWHACKGMIIGEDGRMHVQTRSVTIRDGGDRKADLLVQLDLLIREGDIDSLFDTTQRFAQWAAARVQPADYPGLETVTPQKYKYVV